MAKKILIIDDDQELVELVCDLLATEDYQTTCAFDGLSGLELARQTNTFDLILLDVMMPGLTGFEVLKALGDHHTPILMLTAKGDDDDKVLGLELGADDYLAKPYNPKELLARIHALLRRAEKFKQPSLQNDELLTVNQISLDLSTHQVHCADNLIILTGTEFQVLHQLMLHSGELVTKEQLYQSVLGRRLTAYDRSIDMHVSNIRRKLNRYIADEKIKTIRGAGYLLLTGGSH